jgi:hypothetical protein
MREQPPLDPRDFRDEGNPKIRKLAGIGVLLILAVILGLIYKATESATWTVVAAIAIAAGSSLTYTAIASTDRGRRAINRVLVKWGIARNPEGEQLLAPRPSWTEQLFFCVSLPVLVVGIAVGDGELCSAAYVGLAWTFLLAGSRELQAARAWKAQSERLRRQLAAGIAVAAYWRDSQWNALEPPDAMVTHPLACALVALVGEQTAPELMGIPVNEFDRYLPIAEEAVEDGATPEPRHPERGVGTGLIPRRYEYIPPR